MELTECTYIIVTKGGKGGALIIMDVDEYVKEYKWQLHNQKH